MSDIDPIEAFAANPYNSALLRAAVEELAGIELKRRARPLCDGDHENMECIEDDGFITCHFSGPIKGIS